ncbi:MAG TPA: zinc-binding dehydrogenase [Victivallales bacterium]|nr:zinc-binding dehydrogenase [Victivallales bacterium]HRU01585.1 zinc-binding dehydrogenase [Victivallales bacterium]
MKSKVIVFQKPYQCSIEEIEIPKLSKGQILARTLYTGVSTGTEIRVFSGEQPGASFPLIPGYENVSEVIDTGKDTNLKSGDWVFAGSSKALGNYNSSWGAQVEYVVQNQESVFKLPEGIDLLKASFAHTAAIAYHGVQRAKVSWKDNVAVVGQGMIGFLASLICKTIGSRVFAVDMLDERLNAVKLAGVDYTFNSKNDNVEKEIKELTNGGVDVAIDATGVASSIDKTTRLLREKPWVAPFPPSGRLVILGSYKNPISFNYFSSLFNIEPDIFISRDIIPDDIYDIIELISRGRFNPLLVPHKVLPYTSCLSAYKDLLEQKITRVIFNWR